MSRVWYGNLQDRLEENKQFCDEIKVGTLATEYQWSDRHPYEVVAVKDQKHVTIRMMAHKAKGDAFSNEWEIISDSENPCEDIVKRGNYWYTATSITPEEAKKIYEGIEIEPKLWACNHGFDLPQIIESGKKKTAYRRINISFGVGEYYYDYEF